MLLSLPGVSYLKSILGAYCLVPSNRFLLRCTSLRVREIESIWETFLVVKLKEGCESEFSEFSSSIEFKPNGNNNNGNPNSGNNSRFRFSFLSLSRNRTSLVIMYS